MIFKIQIIMASKDTVRSVYRDLWFFRNLGYNINDKEIPTNILELFRRFTVFWLDKDSHQVLINNQQDYCNMFSIMYSFTTPTLYLEEKTKWNSKSRIVGNNWAFVCSNCHVQRLAGFCYKCFECEDYRLCCDCENRQVHEEHAMIRFDSLEKENSFNKNFSINKKIVDNPKGNSALANPTSNQFKHNLHPAYVEKEEDDEQSTLGRPRRLSDASTFQLSEDDDPVAALTTLFDRFRAALNQVEERLGENSSQSSQSSRSERDFATKTVGRKGIEKAVKKLVAMGYKNKGNWLTHLLKSVNGDINEALNLLNPAK